AVQSALGTDATPGSQGLRDLSTARGFLTGPGIAPLLDAPWAPLFIMALFLLHPLLAAVGTLGGVLLVILAILIMAVGAWLVIHQEASPGALFANCSASRRCASRA